MTDSARPPARTVAISREHGAGGERVGALVAERLGFRYVDDEIVAEAAARGGIGTAEIADAERRRSFALRLLEQIGRASPPAYGAQLVAHRGALEEYQELIRTVVAETAEQGEAVIVAHAASIALADRPDVLRVLVTAPAGVRARRLADGGEVEPERAERLVESSDADRRAYFKSFYGLEELPSHYDLVVNTERLSDEEAAGLVAAAAGRP